MGEQRLRLVFALAVGLVAVTACQAEPSITTTPTSAEELLAERAAATATPVPTVALPTPTVTPEPTPTLAEPATPTVDAETPTSPTPGSSSLATEDVTCTAVGVDSFGDVQLLVETVGIDRRANLRIDYDLIAEGALFEESSSFLYGIGPAEVVRQDVDSFEDLPEGLRSANQVTCAITGVAWSEPEDTFDHTSQCTALVDETGAISIRAETSVNPGTSVGRSVALRYALSTSEDRWRFAEGSHTVQGLSGPSSLDLLVDTFRDVPAGTQPEQLRCEITLVESDFFPEVVLPSEGSQCALAGVDTFGDLQLEVTTTLGEDEAVGASFIWSVRNTEGVILMTGRSFVGEDEVVVGAAQTYAVDTFEKPRDPEVAAEALCVLIGLG